MTQLDQDLSLYDRRASLRLLGGAAACLWLQGCGGPPGPMRSYPDVIGKDAAGASCIAFPGETEGPYPADGRGRSTVTNLLGGAALERSDIRSSFGAMRGTAEGVPLALALRLVDVDRGCAPLAGRALYLWHCDAAGRYSLYDLDDQNYLRGLQISDADGMVRFTTIFPGCYAGRFPHLHFEVFDDPKAAKSGSDARLTSQLALPETACRAVYAASSLYPASVGNLAAAPIASDTVFGDNTPAQLKAQTLAVTGTGAAGLRASATIGLTARYGARVGA